MPSPAPAAPVGAGPATQVFAYDRFGNRALVNGSYSTGGSPVAQVSGTPTAAQLEAAAAVNFTNNRTNAYTHDSSGNVLSLNGTSTYDGENRLVTATYIPDPTMTNLIWTLRHTYDGDGRRVKTERIKPDGTTVDSTTTYVYGAGGELVQEYGSPVVTPGRTYLTGDALGSTRLVTKSGGDATTIVSSRHDYLPFGEEINRGTGFGGGPTQKFTGKERDAETGLDWMKTRYFSGAQGRFTSPDKPFADQFPEDPQSWNLYTYVRNNPLKMVDEDGQSATLVGALGGGIIGAGVAAWRGESVWKGAASGAVAGALAGLVIDTGGAALGVYGAAAAGGALGGVGGGVVGRALNGQETTVQDVAVDAALGAAGGVAGAAAGKAVVAVGQRIAGPSAAFETLRPGPYASESVPATGPRVTPAQAQQLRGEPCHTCGTTNPGTRSGNPVGDHQPSTGLAVRGQSQQLYPHCTSCSGRQGSQVRQQNRTWRGQQTTGGQAGAGAGTAGTRRPEDEHN